MGALAIPWGFHMCGFELALALLTVNALISFFTCLMLVESAKFFGSRNVRTFSDLGFMCFGSKGYVLVGSVYFLNQAMTGISYILFFLTQLESILPLGTERVICLVLLIALLTPISMLLRSMKHISYLQVVALCTLLLAIGSVWVTALHNIATPQFDKHFHSFDLGGIPYFFGICVFAFEGSAVTLEIYTKMQHKKTHFTKALGLGIGIATALFMVTGILFYHAFA